VSRIRPRTSTIGVCISYISAAAAALRFARTTEGRFDDMGERNGRVRPKRRSAGQWGELTGSGPSGPSLGCFFRDLPRLAKWSSTGQSSRHFGAKRSESKRGTLVSCKPNSRFHASKPPLSAALPLGAALRSLKKRTLSNVVLLGPAPVAWVVIQPMANYPWLLMVPRRAEIIEKSPISMKFEQDQLMDRKSPA